MTGRRHDECCDQYLAEPGLRAFELVDGTYREVAHAAGDEPFAAQRPFLVTIVPARLIAKLRPPAC